ncbi:MAG: cupredoxin domain-containing protein [Actinomycetota bacterium]
MAATLIGVSFLVLLAPFSVGETSKFKAQECKGNPHWEPTSRSISKGDRIIWKNPTKCEHTVTAYGGNWNKDTTLGSGEQTRKKFKKTGQFKFRCMTPGHSVIEGGDCEGMCGTVNVSG